MITIGEDITLKGATLIIGFWTILLILIIILLIRAWINREKIEDYNDLRKKFRGISSQPEFCQAIYLAFKAQQHNLTAIVTAGTENNKDTLFSPECPTCVQIVEGSTMPYSDNTCPQCGRDVASYLF